MKNLDATFEQLAVQGLVHPNYYTGSGRWSRRSTDYAGLIVNRLEDLGMVRGRHFAAGNDAPHGGHSGEWVRLMPLGRRRKVFQNIRAAAAISQDSTSAALVEATKPAFDFESLSEREIMHVWHDAGAVHPAPDEVLQIKLRSGASWKMVSDSLSV
jgi:hypothetical protein